MEIVIYYWNVCVIWMLYIWSLKFYFLFMFMKLKKNFVYLLFVNEKFIIKVINDFYFDMKKKKIFNM